MNENLLLQLECLKAQGYTEFRLRNLDEESFRGDLVYYTASALHYTKEVRMAGIFSYELILKILKDNDYVEHLLIEPHLEIN